MSSWQLRALHYVEDNLTRAFAYQATIFVI